MNEAEMPFESITVGTEIVKVTRDNLKLITHLGANAIYDHCYVVREQGGAFIWAYNPGFKTFERFAHEHGAFMILNKSTLSEADRNEYLSQVTFDSEFANEFAMRWVEDQAEV